MNLQKEPTRPGSWIVSNLDATDIPEIMNIERASFADPWDRAAFERELINDFSRSFVTRSRDQRLVGYCVYWLAGTEYHVLNIASHPDLRGQGVGRFMMSRVIDDAHASGAEFVALEVRPSNTPARTLYLSLGFRVVGVRTRYYRNGEDAEVMLLHLRRQNVS